MSSQEQFPLEWAQIQMPMKINPKEIKTSKLEILLEEINPEKSNGPGDKHSAVLNRLSKELAEPLTRIFKSSILFGEVPND